MKKIVFISLIIVPSVTFGMERNAEIEKKADQIADEVAALRKPKVIQDITPYLKWSPQPALVGIQRFNEIIRLCAFDNIPVMNHLINNSTIKADTCYQEGNCRSTLLVQAIKESLMDVSNGVDTRTVNLLLEKGADANGESYFVDENGICKKDCRGRVSIAITPLCLATDWAPIKGMPVTMALLKHKADINQINDGNTAFMNIVSKYRDKLRENNGERTTQSFALYSLMETCIRDYGASVAIPSECDDGEILTPLQFVQKHKHTCTELIELFEQYVKP